MDLQGQRALLPPVPQALAPAVDVQSRALCSGSASTSGRPASSAAPVSQGLLSHLYRHNVEIDLLLRIEVRRPVLLLLPAAVDARCSEVS
jgi:E3 ubiquitin-protein ligase BOI-like protein